MALRHIAIGTTLELRATSRTNLSHRGLLGYFGLFVISQYEGTKNLYICKTFKLKT